MPVGGNLDPLGLNENPPAKGPAAVPTGVPGYLDEDGNWVDLSSSPEQRKAAAAQKVVEPPGTVQNTTSPPSGPISLIEDAPRPVDETGGGLRQIFDPNRDPTRGPEDVSGLVGNKPRQTPQYGKELTGPPPEGRGSLPPEQPQAPRGPSGGGGGFNIDAGIAQYGADWSEQIAAAEREKEAGSALTAQEGENEKAVEAARYSNAQEVLDQARNAHYQQQGYLDDYERFTHAYANGEVDQDKWWRERSVPQKVSTMIGAFFLGLGGHPETALNYVNEQVDRSIAIQQNEIEKNRKVAGHFANLYDYSLNQFKESQKAYDFTRAVYLDNVMSDAARAAAPLKDKVQRAQMDQFIAAMKQQRDASLLKISAKMGGGGAGGPASGYMPLEGGATTAVLQDGTQLYIPSGGEEVKKSIEFSDRSITAANELAQYADPKNIPNPLTHPQDYQVYIGGLRERLKTLSVLGAQHLGTGGRGNVATMQAYRNAIAGPDNDQKGWWGALSSYPSLTAGGVAQSIAQNARDFAKSAAEDRDAVIRTHGAIPGRTVGVGVHGTGEFKGMGITKPMFQAGAPSPNPPASQAQPQTVTPKYGSFQPGQ